MFKNAVYLAGFFIFAVNVASAQESRCASYEQLTDRLSQQFGEQKLFGAFNDSPQSGSASTVYEFWSNPERGNWSLVALKLVAFLYAHKKVTSACAFLVDSGQFHQLLKEASGSVKSPDNDSSNDNDGFGGPGCLAHNRLAEILADRHKERPILHALTNDQSLLEVYGGTNSWTIARAKLQGLRNPLSGGALPEQPAGQEEVFGLCSLPILSGKSWGLFNLMPQAF